MAKKSTYKKMASSVKKAAKSVAKKAKKAVKKVMPTKKAKKRRKLRRGQSASGHNHVQAQTKNRPRS